MQSKPSSRVKRPRQLPQFAGFASVSDADLIDREDKSQEMSLLSARAVGSRRRAFRRGRHAGHDALAAIGLDHGPILSGGDRAPRWPDGVIGAISHASDFSVAVTAPSFETDGVGVDVEVFRPVPDLARYVPVPEEMAWLEELEAGDRAWSLLQLFSAKEAIFKAFYPRVQQLFGFDAAFLRPHESGFTAQLTHPIDPDYPAEREFLIHSEREHDLVMNWLVLPKT